MQGKQPSLEQWSPARFNPAVTMNSTAKQRFFLKW